MEILNVENLSFKYPKSDNPTLKNISFNVEKGDFIAVCGATGSGKSTLLRLMKKELTLQGNSSGKILYKGTPIDELPADISAASIGFVMQNPEHQIVTDKVWHELAFGLENLNTPQNVIASRIAEMSAYFGISSWFDKKTSELSGGQKQLLNLAAVCVMQPDILILDEPTAQLDPITAADFIATLKRLNRDLSLTVIIVEHRLEEIIPVCNKMLVLKDGEVLTSSNPSNAAKTLCKDKNLSSLMPVAARIYSKLCEFDDYPLSVSEGRKFLEKSFKNSVKSLPKNDTTETQKPVIEVKNLCFKYSKNSPNVLDSLGFSVFENEIFCILGSNGSGKTTALSAVSGLIKPYSGKIEILGKNIKEYKNQSLYNSLLALLPQDVQTVFLKNTVKEELADAKVDTDALPFDISHLLDKHPYDISGGEQQLVALAKVLACNPKILLLDEPTKGLDNNAKLKIADILKDLKKSGMTILLVTHDVEFAALCADRCAMFFRGNIVSVGQTRDFFSQNSFYTTACVRMTKGFYENAVTEEDVLKLCEINGEKEGGFKC